MSVLLLLVVVLVLAAAAFVVCRQKVMASVQGNPRDLHSLPNYYGWHGAIMAALPAFVGLLLWLIVQPMIVENRISGYFPPEKITEGASL